MWLAILTTCLHTHTHENTTETDRTSQTFVIGHTHKNVQFRPPDRLTTQSEKSLDLAVRWSAFSLLSMPLHGRWYMPHGLLQMNPDDKRWTMFANKGV